MPFPTSRFPICSGSLFLSLDCADATALMHNIAAIFNLTQRCMMRLLSAACLPLANKRFEEAAGAELFKRVTA